MTIGLRHTAIHRLFCCIAATAIAEEALGALEALGGGVIGSADAAIADKVG